MNDAEGPAIDLAIAPSRELHALASPVDDASRGGPVGGVSREKARLLAALDRQIASIDELLSDQVNAILHTPAFQRLEAAWRGLFYVIESAEGIAGTKVRVLSTAWNELVRDFDRASDFDQS